MHDSWQTCGYTYRSKHTWAVKETLYLATTQFSTCSWSWISLWMDLTMRDLSSAHHVHNSALYVCISIFINHALIPQYRPDVMCSHSLHRKWLPSLVPRFFFEGGSEPGDEGGGYPTVLCSLALLLGTYPSLKPRLSILDFVSQLWRQNLERRAWVRGYTYPFSFRIQHSLYSDIQWCTHIQNSSNYIYFM